MEALNKGEALVFGEDIYRVKRVISGEKTRFVYFVSNGTHFYVIKELLASPTKLRKNTVRDVHTKQAVFADGFVPDEPVEAVGNWEIRANSIAVRDADNNSSRVFPARQLPNKEPRAAAYLLIYSVTGKPLDAVRGEWHDDFAVQAVDTALKAAEALDLAMHKKGLLHLDIKPNNLYLTDDKTVKLIDLGSSYPLDQASVTDDMFDTIQSTKMYQSPLLSAIASENNYHYKNRARLAALAEKLSVKDDIFALAKTLIFLLSGTCDKGKIRLQDDVCQAEVMRVINKATYGCTVEAVGRSFATGEYESCDELIMELRELREIIENNGLHDAVILRKGKAFVNRQMRMRKLELQEDLIPDIKPLD